jgi:dipeptidyl-peptidase-3
LLDRVEDAAIVQLYADGFSSLPLKQKTLIWHLYEAALAGRDIYIDQRTQGRARDARGVRADQLRIHRASTPQRSPRSSATAKLFWLNNGPYNNLTARKFVLNSSRAAQGRR